jgi:catechol 2,3-dioxygenase-like lactoylglutathione lyase family enzyme
VASTNDFKYLHDSGAASPSWSREAVPVRRLDHILLAMPAGREADARKFYQDILGIPEAQKPPDLAARGGCWFEAGELKVHLGVEKNFAPARKAHPAFIVDDLKGLTAILQNAGYAIAHDQPLEGYDRIFVDDPFGNRIELMEVKPS